MPFVLFFHVCVGGTVLHGMKAFFSFATGMIWRELDLHYMKSPSNKTVFLYVHWNLYLFVLPL